MALRWVTVKGKNSEHRELHEHEVITVVSAEETFCKPFLL